MQWNALQRDGYQITHLQKWTRGHTKMTASIGPIDDRMKARLCCRGPIPMVQRTTSRLTFSPKRYCGTLQHEKGSSEHPIPSGRVFRCQRMLIRIRAETLAVDTARVMISELGVIFPFVIQHRQLRPRLGV